MSRNWAEHNELEIKREPVNRFQLGIKNKLHTPFVFFLDQIEKGLINIEYCPTDKMIGDFITKGLQGNKFKNSIRLLWDINRLVLYNTSDTISTNNE